MERQIVQAHSPPLWDLLRAIYIFTKLMKPILARLRAAGHMSICYLDDLYIQGDTYEQCESSVTASYDLLQGASFHVNTEKSILTLSCEAEFLGFHLKF